MNRHETNKHHHHAACPRRSDGAGKDLKDHQEPRGDGAQHLWG